MPRLVNNCFCDTLRFHTNGLADKSSKNDVFLDESAAIMGKKTPGANGYEHFPLTRSSLDNMLFMNILLVNHTNGNQKGTTMFLSRFFKKVTHCGLEFGQSCFSKLNRRIKEEPLTCYCKVVICHLQTWATDIVTV